jgi:biuret amidohydrolase
LRTRLQFIRATTRPKACVEVVMGNGAVTNKPARQLIEGTPVLVIIDAHKPGSASTSRLIEAAGQAAVSIVFACPARASASAGTQFATGANAYVIRPWRHSIFFGTELPILLKEIGASTLILAGGETNTSVHYSFVDAHQYDYFCRVAQDCVTGSSPRAHDAALRAMEYMQTGARRKSDELIAAFHTARTNQATT